MLAYAASRPVIANRRASPNSMLLIASAHVVGIAFLMSAKMDLPIRIIEPPLRITTYPVPRDPPEKVNPPQPTPSGPTTAIDRDPRIDLPPLTNDQARPDPGPSAVPSGPGVQPFPRIDIKPLIEKHGPVLLTSQGELKPPYPRAKLLAEEEASLTLRLSIDERGRVVAVEPMGRADPIFLAAARKHLLAHWRYKPAIADGRNVASTLITTLHFRLDG